MEKRVTDLAMAGEPGNRGHRLPHWRQSCIESTGQTGVGYSDRAGRGESQVYLGHLVLPATVEVCSTHCSAPALADRWEYVCLEPR